MSSPAVEFPHGRYFSVPIDIGAEYGGQTRATLMRNRLFVTEAGLSPVVMTFTPRTDWAERRDEMLERGMLLPQIATPNIYDHYRDIGWGTKQAPPDASPDPWPVDHLRRVDDRAQDGTPWRVAYQDCSGRVVLYDYLRQDGTAYLRIPTFVFKEPSTWPKRIDQLGSDGSIVGTFGSIGQWFRRWIRELTEGERSFVFIDSRFNAQHIVPMRAPHVYLIYMLHNIHVLAPRHWSSPTTEIYARLLRKIPQVDAMVTLTDRQREDIVRRRGRTNNLFVAPNPVEMPEQVEVVERDPHLVAVVARLEKQKRLTDAIKAFDLVRQKVPQARLDIYGEGSERATLESTIERLGLGDHVHLRGHDPHAREALWRASAFLVTSSYEGWNLAMQESMSHGCPVVSYDVRYGPREQIDDGVNGFLVPWGDTAALAGRVVELLDSPELSHRISAAATERARASKERFRQDWKHILESVIELKPGRTRIKDVRLEVSRLEVGPSRGRWPLPLPRNRFQVRSGTREDTLHFTGQLTVIGHSKNTDLGSAALTLSAVDAASGTLVELPLGVRHHNNRFTLSSTVPVGDLLDAAPRGADLALRLCLVWGNSSRLLQLGPGQDSESDYRTWYDALQRFRLRKVSSS